jgi:Transcriptional Coactivator p15 (PC4)
MTARRAQPVTLTEPIEVAKFWRNRRGEAVIVSLRTFEGRILVDCRIFFTASDGRLQATKKGLSLAVARLPELAEAITKALAQARTLGLIGDDDDGGDQ